MFKITVNKLLSAVLITEYLIYELDSQRGRNKKNPEIYKSRPESCVFEQFSGQNSSLVDSLSVKWWMSRTIRSDLNIFHR